jgi:hypothetical protein
MVELHDHFEVKEKLNKYLELLEVLKGWHGVNCCSCDGGKFAVGMDLHYRSTVRCYVLDTIQGCKITEVCVCYKNRLNAWQHVRDIGSIVAYVGNSSQKKIDVNFATM